MMAPSDVLQSSQQRTIMPRLATAVKTEKVGRVSRDDRRRATHNEGKKSVEIFPCLAANGGFSPPRSHKIDSAFTL